MKKAESARPGVRALGVGAALASVLTVVSGCSLFGPSGDTPTAPTTQSSAPGAKAVREVLAAVKPLAAKEKQPTAEMFFSALTKAGYKKSALEFSIDKTPLDTGVPAKVFGVRVSEGCVIGEIRDGKATAQLAEPTKSTGSCLLGQVQRPDGVATPTGRARPSDQTGPTGLPGEGGSGSGGSGSDGGQISGH